MATAKTKTTASQPTEPTGEWTQYDPHGLLKAIQAMRAEADEMEGLAATLAERANRLRIRAEKAIQLAVLATPAMSADTPQELPVAVRLRYEDQLEYSDIAERLGVSIDAAEDRLNANPPHRPAAGGIVAPGFRGRGRGGALLAGLGSILGYQAIDGLTGGDNPIASELGNFALNEALDRGLSGGRGGSLARDAGRSFRGLGGRLGSLGRSGGRVLGAAGAAFSAVELGKLAYDCRALSHSAGSDCSRLLDWSQQL